MITTTSQSVLEVKSSEDEDNLGRGGSLEHGDAARILHHFTVMPKLNSYCSTIDIYTLNLYIMTQKVLYISMLYNDHKVGNRLHFLV